MLKNAWEKGDGGKAGKKQKREASASARLTGSGGSSTRASGSALPAPIASQSCIGNIDVSVLPKGKREFYEWCQAKKWIFQNHLALTKTVWNIMDGQKKSIWFSDSLHKAVKREEVCIVRRIDEIDMRVSLHHVSAPEAFQAKSLVEWKETIATFLNYELHEFTNQGAELLRFKGLML